MLLSDLKTRELDHFTPQCLGRHEQGEGENPRLVSLATSHLCFGHQTYASQRHWCHSHAHGPRHRGHERRASRGRGRRGHGRLGCENGRGHGGRSRGHGGRPCEGSSRHDGGEERCYGHDGGSGRASEGGHRHGHGPSRSARTQRGECGPTAVAVSYAKGDAGSGYVPQSSRCRHVRCACCASHDRHRQHPDEIHTPRTRNWSE